jgi:PAS domain S-box-containing protein
MRSPRRDVEIGLVGIVAIAIAIAVASTWHDIDSDRKTTLAASANLTEALAESIENHVDTVFRDAGNAALSAALLVEQAGGAARLGDERRLHQELRREQADDSSTARLVLAGPDGRAIASSRDFPVQQREVGKPAGEERVLTAAGRPFRLGHPMRSAFGGELVIPFSVDVLDSTGRPAGEVRAEIRVGHFTQAWQGFARERKHAIVLGTMRGATLARVPMREDYLLGQSSSLAYFQQRFIRGDSGHTEFTSVRDGIVRYYAWRRMRMDPLFLAVGLEKEAVLAPWRDRARTRAWVVGAACLGLVLVAGLLAWHLRRLAHSEDDLRDAQARYLSAMEASSIAIVITDLDGRWRHLNSAACRLTGYSRQELLALPAGALLVHAEDLVQRGQRMRALASGRLAEFSRETVIRRKDGSECWVHLHAQLMRDGEGLPANVIIHAQDITPRKLAEAELVALNRELDARVQQRTAELTQANQDLEAFTYSAAHDIRSPLVTLGGFADLLVRDLGEVPVKAGRRLESIRKQIRHMTQTVDDLLAFARSGQGALRTTVVDVYGLVGEICEQLDMQAGDRQLTWVVNPMPEVLADRGSLREALANILGNALKYSRGREHTRIEVGCASEGGGMAEFYVRDNGAGFDPANAADLFKPFRRLHSASQFEGTGVGLAIVQRIVERNGGRIWAEAPPDGGAVFRFTLPIAPTETSAPAAAPAVTA